MEQQAVPSADAVSGLSSSVGAQGETKRPFAADSGIALPVFPPVERSEKPEELPAENATPTPRGAARGLHLEIEPDDCAYDTVKRVFDAAVALLLLVLLSPVLAFVALFVRLSSPGPVVFRQQRLTRGGKVFTMLKFRTMRADAEAGTGPVWASSRDPRVTAIGYWLRLFRLDELPQLLNVVRGDMSLIGPRPERPEMALSLQRDLPSFRKRLAVRGGITGLAQVESGYSDSIESYRRKLAFDIMYVRRRSLALDVVILVKTLLVIVTADGTR